MKHHYQTRGRKVGDLWEYFPLKPALVADL
jgi:hypothetical protein